MGMDNAWGEDVAYREDWLERCFPRDGQRPRRRCDLRKYGAQGNDVFPRMDNGQGEGWFKKMMGPRENMFPGEKMGRENVSPRWIVVGEKMWLGGEDGPVEKMVP
jgi:hypothetical protein